MKNKLLLSLCALTVLQLQADAETDLMNIDMAIYRRTYNGEQREGFNILTDDDDIIDPKSGSDPLEFLWPSNVVKADQELQLRYWGSEEARLIAPLILESSDYVQTLAREEVLQRALIKINQNVFVWDVWNNLIYKVLESDNYHGEETQCFCCNLDKARGLVCTNKRLLTWSFATNEVREGSFVLQNGEKCEDIKFNIDKNESLIITNKRILVCDLITFELKEAPLLSFPYDKESIFYIDKNEVLIVRAKQVYIWNTLSNNIARVPFILREDSFIYSCQRFRNERKLLMSSPHHVLVWDMLKNETIVAPFTVYEDENDEIKIAYLNKNRDKAVIETFTRVLLWDLTKNEIVMHRFNLCDDFDEITFTNLINEGTKIVIGTENHVFIWDAETNDVEEASLTEQSDGKQDVYSARYDRDKNKVYIEWKDCMYTWDLETKKIERTFFDYEEPIYYTKDGSKLITHAVTPSRRYHSLAQKSLLWLLWKLTDEQLGLLKEAAKSWQVDQAYELTDDELGCYETLPKELKRHELFVLSAIS